MEAAFVQWLRKRIGAPPGVRLGIGDDAAVVDLPSARSIVTSDMLMDGVDFRLDECDPRRAGRKSLAVNLSDLAAMAARPVAAIVSLAIPSRDGQRMAREVYEGIIDLANDFSVPIVGGDTNSWSGPFVVSITLLGQPTGSGPVPRGGGLAGDEILVTGDFGGSILERHFDFLPRIEEAIWIHEHEELHAAIDVSDGLSLDLSRLAAASGCGAEIDTRRVPVSDAARQLSTMPGDELTPLEHALGDGEDFELIMAVPPEVAARLLASQPLETHLTSIGRLVPEPGLWQVNEGRHRTPLKPRGYEHL